VPRFASVYTKEIVDGVETWWIRTLKYTRTASLRRVLSWIDFELKLWLMPKSRLARPDVVIASSLSLLSVFNGYWLKKRYGSRLLFEVRDIWPLTLTEEGGFHRWHPLTLFLAAVERFGYRSADAIVGTMPNLSEHVKNVTGMERPCHCVPIGLDQSVYDNAEPLPDGYAERYIPKDRFIVGYAGSIGQTNALETIVECVERMRDNPRVHFVFVGDGAMVADYAKRAAGLSNVTFAPRLHKSQVSSFLAKCDLLYFSAMNSRVWRYGQSMNKLIDYMYAGKPIIGSYSGYPSMLNEAQCGVFVPAADADALLTAIEGYAWMPPEELASIGARGRAWLVEHRRYETLAREYARLF